MRAAGRRLGKLQSLGHVHRDATPHWRSPHVVRLTKAGAKAGELDIAPARLFEPEIRHSLALVDLMEQLTEAHPDCEARTEREIRTDRRHERSWARGGLGMDAPLTASKKAPLAALHDPALVALDSYGPLIKSVWFAFLFSK